VREKGHKRREKREERREKREERRERIPVELQKTMHT